VSVSSTHASMFDTGKSVSDTGVGVSNTRVGVSDLENEDGAEVGVQKVLVCLLVQPRVLSLITKCRTQMLKCWIQMLKC